MKNWTWTLLLLILFACGQKNDNSNAGLTNKFCGCFSPKTSGNIDDRLTPCLQETLDEKQKDLLASTQNVDSIKKELNKLSLDIMIEMTRSCDKYFAEINTIYDNGYPLDSSRANKEQINFLTTKIDGETNNDSIKALLHKKIYKLIQSRQYTEALTSIDLIKSMDKNDYGANLASAYVFNQLKMHDKAIVEIEKAIEL